MGFVPSAYLIPFIEERDTTMDALNFESKDEVIAAAIRFVEGRL